MKRTCLLIAFSWIAFLGTSCLHSAMAAQAFGPGKTGYDVGISSQWADSTTGYRPLRVSVTTNPKTPVGKDRNFTVVIKNQRYNGPSEIVTAPLVIKSGTSSNEVELYLPCLNNSFYSRELIVESGVPDFEFNSHRDLLYQNMGISNSGYQLEPSTLVVSTTFTNRQEVLWYCSRKTRNQQATSTLNSGAKLPSLHHMSDVYSGFTTNRGGSSAMLTGPSTAIAQNGQIHGCRPLDLPINWIGLSGIQQMIISLADFQIVCTQHEQRRDAIEKWVAAGGSLIVCDIGKDLKVADKLRPLLLGKKRTSQTGVKNDKWQEPSRELRQKSKMIRRQSVNNYYVDEESTVTVEQAFKNNQSPFVEHESLTGIETTSPFIVTDHVNGRIVAVGDDMQKWKTEWKVLANTLAAHGSSLEANLGTSNQTGFVNGFRIPGVGDPPVGAFQVLIGFFLFTAGPVVYIILRRTRQMQLLFVLIPLISLSTCLGLMGYAIFVDGFDSWGRVESVTQVDQTTKSAVSSARVGYYSGVQPGAYSFDYQTVPFVPTKSSSSTAYNEQGKTANELSGGSIRPRTPHQATSVRSFEMEQRLTIIEKKGQDGFAALPQVRNQLGASADYIAVNVGGEYFVVENLANEKQTETELAQPAEISDSLKDLATKLSPNLTGRYGNRNYADATPYQYNYISDSDWGHEYAVIQTLRIGNGAKLLNRPNTYIAILQSFSPVENQIEPVQYKNEFHVIIGTW